MTLKAALTPFKVVRAHLTFLNYHMPPPHTPSLYDPPPVVLSLIGHILPTVRSSLFPLSDSNNYSAVKWKRRPRLRQEYYTTCFPRAAGGGDAMYSCGLASPYSSVLLA